MLELATDRETLLKDIQENPLELANYAPDVALPVEGLENHHIDGNPMDCPFLNGSLGAVGLDKLVVTQGRENGPADRPIKEILAEKRRQRAELKAMKLTQESEPQEIGVENAVNFPEVVTAQTESINKLEQLERMISTDSLSNIGTLIPESSVEPVEQKRHTSVEVVSLEKRQLRLMQIAPERAVLPDEHDLSLDNEYKHMSQTDLISLPPEILSTTFEVPANTEPIHEKLPVKVVVEQPVITLKPVIVPETLENVTEVEVELEASHLDVVEVSMADETMHGEQLQVFIPQEHSQQVIQETTHTEDAPSIVTENNNEVPVGGSKETLVLALNDPEIRNNPEVIKLLQAVIAPEVIPEELEAIQAELYMVLGLEIQTLDSAVLISCARQILEEAGSADMSTTERLAYLNSIGTGEHRAYKLSGKKRDYPKISSFLQSLLRANLSVLPNEG